MLYKVVVQAILFWIRDMGDDPLDRLYPEIFPPQGGLLVDGDETEYQYRRALVIPAASSGDVGRGPGGGGDLHTLPPEHHHPI